MGEYKIKRKRIEKLTRSIMNLLLSYLMSDVTAKHRPGPQTDWINVPLSAAQTLIEPARSELTTLLPSSIAVTAVTGAWCRNVATTSPKVKPHTRTVLSSDPKEYTFLHFFTYNLIANSGLQMVGNIRLKRKGCVYQTVIPTRCDEKA